MTHRRRASALHAAHAGAGAAFCAALGACALAFEHPLLLAAVAVAALGAARAAGVGREVARTARFTIPLALLVALVNPFVVRDGLTVFARLGSVPVLGQLDLTVEALVYGLVLGVRVVVVVLCCALFSAAIDPYEVLRLFRRVSFRSALTAALATRLMPVLARDARRMADAQATRARGPAGRVAVLRAVTTGALDRALDVAATLEVRGYAGRPRQAPGRARLEALGRHDLAFGTAAVALVVLLLAATASGAAAFAAYPRLGASLGPAQLALAVALVAVALAPFLDRWGIER
jgi:energy-coupling factor transport system permease protein